ncbi:Uncharacterised protein [Mycobacterium tuberculosis]|uniref:Uncharacterized protein n=1 Tax=Mycobacterium tuberculosis TaxID=1773 RepID=A0A655APG4_MYCTX|nr:Uncharacterised protein [Mycobacterium tuberculosis]CKT97741.1 Uncharacterised protein [Mycobacterium tuberculosis]CNV29277.1 Uncharacterised protein [Mycobacterium tuberculosis]CNV74856.1 Uncharacterised protein [Mycobacterium tuberculosis]
MPPLTTDTPALATSGAISRSAMIRAPDSVRRCRSANSGVAAIFNATALPAMTCMSGPPCCPGNTAELIALAYCCLPTIRPERPPPSVLCTVVDTTSACGTGDGCNPAATRPAKCAMSTSNLAPTSSAIDRNAAKSSTRG